ncbi:hypothetical protein SUGI_0229490 [Cryptomeria japonica]|nr:hypothetical protein SUGI_0229490 [Cryptomeria japonica]
MGYQKHMNGWFRKDSGKDPGKVNLREESELGGSGIAMVQKEKCNRLLIDKERPLEKVEQGNDKSQIVNPYVIPIKDSAIQMNLEFLESSIWFRIYNLPAEFWIDNIIRDIGRKIGRYTFMDSPLVDQKWDLYFRIYVKVASELEFPEEIDLVAKNNSWKVTIKCEEKLDLCPNCKLVHHRKENFFSKVTVKGLHKFVQSPMLREEEREAKGGPFHKWRRKC